MDMFEGVGRRLDQRTGSFLDIGQHSLNGRERNCLFRNDGDGTFTEVGWVNDADRVEDGRGLAIFDYDRDGRLDLVVRNYRQPAELLRNGGPARHWVEGRLVGGASKRDGGGGRLPPHAPAGRASPSSVVDQLHVAGAEAGRRVGRSRAGRGVVADQGEPDRLGAAACHDVAALGDVNGGEAGDLART